MASGIDVGQEKRTLMQVHGSATVHPFTDRLIDRYVYNNKQQGIEDEQKEKVTYNTVSGLSVRYNCRVKQSITSQLPVT